MKEGLYGVYQYAVWHRQIPETRREVEVETDRAGAGIGADATMRWRCGESKITS